MINLTPADQSHRARGLGEGLLSQLRHVGLPGAVRGPGQGGDPQTVGPGEGSGQTDPGDAGPGD